MVKFAKIILVLGLISIHPNTDTTCPYATFFTPANGTLLWPPHGQVIVGFSEPLRTGVFDEVHGGTGTLLPAVFTCNADITLCQSDPTIPAEIAMTYTLTGYSETGSPWLAVLPPIQDVNGNRLSGMVGPISPCDPSAWADVSSTITTSSVRFECPQNLSDIQESGFGYWLFTGSTTSYTQVTIDFSTGGSITTATVDTYDDPGGSGYRRFDFGASIQVVTHGFTATTIPGTGGSDIISINGVLTGTIPSCP